MTLPRLTFAAALLAGSTAHAAPELDFLTADDETPVALDLDGSGDLILASDADGGDATLVRLDVLGARKAQTRLSGAVTDLAVDRRTGHVLVADESGLTAFDPGFVPLWRLPLPVTNLAVGEHGTVAGLAASELHILDEHGRTRSVVDPGFAARDLAVLDAAGLVAVTGSLPCAGLDSLALAAFDHTGAARWMAHGDREECDTAARGVALSRGDDGQLYLLAEVDGRLPAYLRARATVVIDGYTDPETANPAQAAYYARFTADGAHQLGQMFSLPAEGSVVRPTAISADEHGNVFLVGTTSHSLGAADEGAVTAALDAPAAFYQVVDPDLEYRRVWHPIEADGMTTRLGALAHASDRVVAILHAAPLPGSTSQTDHLLPVGPTILVWPDDHGPLDAEKRPNPDTQGTFGYESGVSGSDPTCYCSAPAIPTPAALLSLGLVGLTLRRRKR